MRTLVGVLVIAAMALVLYAVSTGEDHSAPVERDQRSQQP